ncbi:FUSC family membrane protein [Zwartia sp.]|uniref:FUSC family protein n=1 Tax=Zwartia sp. TaxID=2978004 RepID=UPI002721D5E6|nr:FUSC family membrane protein [Zwartia sp.]MDO9025306.1 FUSC family membrane protein [Zwartia sp.]
MNETASQIQRFLFSHHFYSGVRRATGMLLPVMVLGGIFGLYTAGLVATFGALCVAFIDQPGPHEHRGVEMLGGTMLSTLTVAVTSLASSHPFLIWLVVIGQCFLYSMLSVYGKRGGQIGFACLLLMTVTMHEALSANEVWLHTLTSFGGGLFYTVFSYSLSRMMNLREKEQALSVALFATSDYVAQRANMYSLDQDLDESYRKLITCQSNMTDKQQAARDMVLRGLSGKIKPDQPKRIMLWNLFVDTIDILDTLVATRTDYSLLRARLADSDILIFMRDALFKMSVDLDRIALAVSREQVVLPRNSVKAELRALEYEIEQMTRNGYAQREPDVYNLCIEILRRLRHSANIVQRMIASTDMSKNAQPIQAMVLDQSLSQFLSREQYRLGMITSNLRLDSPICRYALRLTLAAGLAMTVWKLVPSLAEQGYWILLTVLIIMKPGFALTRQRNGWRLFGTLIGCVVALGALYLTDNNTWLFAAMVLSTIIGGSLLQLNYMIASVFNTNAVLLAFHFVDPTAATIISDRAIDTLIGSVISFGCSYFLPWWEAQFMPSLARAAINANREYLRAGLEYVETCQTHKKDPQNPEIHRADIAWRLTRKNVHVALGNFAEAFYRMMLEPRSRQWHVIEFNNLMIQTHMLASQINAVMHALTSSPQANPIVTEHLAKVIPHLKADSNTPLPELPATIIDGSLPNFAYPMTQLQKTIMNIDDEISVIHSHLPPTLSPSGLSS